MKKNAFTLIELIAVVTILALIAMVVFPAVSSVITSSRNDAYKAQKDAIEKAAKEYCFDHVEALDNGTVTLEQLTSSGYLEEDSIKDPRHNGKTLSGTVIITYELNQYVFEYKDN